MKNSHAIGIAALALLQGGYMLFDGVHKLTTGTYFGSQLGPWARVVSAAGIDPNSMAPAFVVVGILWLAAAGSLLLRMSWARVLLITLAVLTLAYPLFGTLFSVVVLVLLFTGKSREGALEAKP